MVEFIVAVGPFAVAMFVGFVGGTLHQRHKWRQVTGVNRADQFGQLR